MKWLKENWFKLFITLAVFFVVGIYANHSFNQTGVKSGQVEGIFKENVGSVNATDEQKAKEAVTKPKATAKPPAKKVTPQSPQSTSETAPSNENSNTLPSSEPPQANTIACNGINWSNCPAGQTFYCPPTGAAQCKLESTPYSNKSYQQQCLEQGLAIVNQALKEQDAQIAGITNLNDKMRQSNQNLQNFTNNLYMVRLLCGTVSTEQQLLHELEEINNSLKKITGY